MNGEAEEDGEQKDEVDAAEVVNGVLDMAVTSSSPPQGERSLH